MKDKEVLQKAIEIAMENSFKKPLNKVEVSEFNNKLNVLFWKGKWFTINESYRLEEVIFSHDFAKAFWGDNYSENITKYFEYENGCVEQESVLNWVYHLQQMVLEENPIDYLRKFIEE
jgi:hypothetical protein